jgi:hypothetical protein
MTTRDRPNQLFADEKGIEGYVTDRLLDFYDGLLARSQINPPAQSVRPEDAAVSLGRIKSERGLNPSRSEGV